MKGKIHAVVTAALLIAAISVSSAFALVKDSSVPPPAATDKQTTLTDAQRAELKKLFEQKTEVNKQIIQKYMEFGILTREQADKKLKRLDEMKKKIEENGFIPRHGKDLGGHSKDNNTAPPAPNKQ